MANIRQYIGARYVFKIYENSADPSSAEWESGVTYEPLTIVTYLNSTYASKKEVPGSVGNPASNPSYWVVTGAYNGQIAQLQQQIDAITPQLQTLINEVDDIPKHRKYILIGDSFGAGIDGDNNTQSVPGGGWIARFSALHPNDTYSTVVPRAGVSGFASSAPFLQQLQDTESQITDKDLITDIIVLGGTNDISYAGTNTLTLAIKDFIDYAKANYQNATVSVGVLGSNQTALRDVVPDYKTILNYGGIYIPLTNLFCDNQYVGADGLHLNATGYAFYQPYITNAIHTLKADFEFVVTTGILENEHYFFKLKVTPNDVQAWLSWDDLSVFMTTDDLTSARLTPLSLHRIYPYNTICQHLFKYELNTSANYAMSPIAILGVQIDNDGYISFPGVNNIAPSFGGSVRTLQMDISPARVVNS